MCSRCAHHEDLAGGRTAVPIYNADRLPTAIALANGLTVTHTYLDVHSEASDSFSTPAVHAALGLKYAYDTLGLVSDRVKAAGDSGRDFRYDPLDRLQRAANYVMTPGQCWQTWEESSGWLCDPAFKTYRDSTVYSYDKVGNRTDLGAVLAPGNRLVKFNGDSLVYDADGNLTKRIRTGQEIQRLYWNSLGQLVAVWTSGADSVNFGYDGSGRRVRKWTSTVTTRSLYDGDDLLAELDAAGNRVAEYTYYLGIDRPLGVRRGGQMYYYAQDFPGSVTGLISSTGAVTNQYRYSAWGVAELAQEGVANGLRFAARQYDVETGLYYNRARYYDPAVGRFVSEDPVGLSAGINPYAYSGNDPVSGRDPSGLMDCSVILARVQPDGHAQPCETGAVTVTASAGPIVIDLSFGLGAGLDYGGHYALPDFAFVPGGWPSGTGTTKSLGPQGPACGGALLSFAANLALDAFTISGVGSGLALVGRGLLRAAAGELLAVSARSVGTLGYQVAGRASVLGGVTAAGRAYAAGGVYLAAVGGLGAGIAYGPELTAALAGASGDWKSFIPGYGTYQSGRELVNCLRGT